MKGDITVKILKESGCLRLAEILSSSALWASCEDWIRTLIKLQTSQYLVHCLWQILSDTPATDQHINICTKPNQGLRWGSGLQRLYWILYAVFRPAAGCICSLTPHGTRLYVSEYLPHLWWTVSASLWNRKCTSYSYTEHTCKNTEWSIIKFWHSCSLLVNRESL